MADECGEVEDTVSEKRRRLCEILSDEDRGKYFRLLRDWFRGKIRKPQFDDAVRQVFGDSNEAGRDLHNEFILAMLYRADGDLEKLSEPLVSVGNKNSGPRRTVKRPLLVAPEKAHGCERLQLEPAPQPFIAPLEGEEAILATDTGLLPTEKEIEARVLIGAWEKGLVGIGDGVPALVKAGIETMLKNILQRTMQLRRSFRSRDPGVPFAFQRPSTVKLSPAPLLVQTPMEIRREVSAAAIAPPTAPITAMGQTDLVEALELWPDIIPVKDLRAAFKSSLLLKEKSRRSSFQGQENEE